MIAGLGPSLRACRIVLKKYDLSQTETDPRRWRSFSVEVGSGAQPRSE